MEDLVNFLMGGPLGAHVPRLVSARPFGESQAPGPGGPSDLIDLGGDGVVAADRPGISERIGRRETANLTKICLRYATYDNLPYIIKKISK